MAAVGNVPYLPGYIVPLCSCHGYNAVFTLKKYDIAPFQGVILGLFSIFSIG